MIDIANYLRSKGVDVRAAGENEIHMSCFFHGEEEKNKKLYVNIDPTQTAIGLFVCFVCGEKGTFNTIRKHFGDPPITFVRDDAQENDLPDDMFCQIMSEVAEYYHEQLAGNLEVLEYLATERGFTIDTIQKAKIGWAADGIITHLVTRGYDIEEVKKTGIIDEYGRDSLRGMITIPYQVHGQVVQIRGRRWGDKGPKYKTPGSDARMYNQDAATTDGMLVITEGEFDCLTLQQLGFNAVALPGCDVLKDEWLPYFAMPRRIILCLDNDGPGRKAAEKHATTLGPRSRIAEMPEDIDVNKWFVEHGKGKEDFEYLFAKSKGGILVSVRECYDRWLEVEGNENLVGLRFGIPAFDEPMRHGLLPGQVIIPLAKTGAGKTISTLNVFQRMSMIKPDIKILFVSLEQTRNEWFERAQRIHAFYNLEATRHDTIKYWENRICLIDENRLRYEQLNDAIEQFSYELGGPPDLVAIDYLGYYARGYRGDAYERTSAATADMKRLAKGNQTTLWVPHQVSRNADFGKELSADMARDSGAVEEYADMIIGLWAPDQKSGTERKDHENEILMKILKVRDGGKDSVAVMQFAPLTLAMVPVTDRKFYGRAFAETQYSLNGDSWETAIMRHRTGNDNPFANLSEEIVVVPHGVGR